MREAQKKKVVILGAGGHARVSLDILRLMGYDVIGFLDSDRKKHGTTINGVPVLGSEDDKKIISLVARPDTEYFVAVGDNALRERIVKKMKGVLGREPVNAIHPDTVISEFSKIGTGNFINCGVKINSNATIGNYTVLNTSATIDHDCLVEDYAFLSPIVSLAGGVVIRRSAFLGIGAKSVPKITVGRNAIIGAGAVLTKDVPACVTAVGIPAKVIKRHDA